MTQRMNGAPEQARMHGVPGETYEERFPRYAHNAGVTAAFSVSYAKRQRRAAGMHAAASGNARARGDTVAADLYDEMRKAALDAADALSDLAALAWKVEKHYTAPEQETRSS
jgi:hypothetical protein